LVDGWRITYTVLKALAVPVNKVEVLLVAKHFNVTVDVRKGYVSSKDEAHSQVGVSLWITLNQLVVWRINVIEYFIRSTRLQLRLDDTI
jgi:hypothetical protein